MGALDWWNGTTVCSTSYAFSGIIGAAGPAPGEQLPHLLFPGAGQILRPRFTTIRDWKGVRRSAIGWNEGKFSLWFFQQDGGSRLMASMNFFLKYKLQSPFNNYYQVQWTRTGFQMFRSRNGTSTSLYTVNPASVTSVKNTWQYMKAQYRWLDPTTKTRFEIRVWGDNGDGTGQHELTPEGGLVDTNPLADDPLSSVAFTSLGYDISNPPTDYIGFYDGIRLEKI